MSGWVDAEKEKPEFNVEVRIVVKRHFDRVQRIGRWAPEGWYINPYEESISQRVTHWRLIDDMPEVTP